MGQSSKVLDLLEYYARTRRPATLAQVSRDLGWPRSSTFSLLQSLAERGFLYEPRARAGYYPSPRWLALTQPISDAEPLPEILHTLVRELSLETGETVAVGGPAGTSALFLAVQESAAAIRYFGQVGHRLPIHASATGRAILGQYSREDRMALYRRIEFRQYSPSTPVSIDEVEAELRRSVERGWHLSRGDYSPDLLGVALPMPLGDRRLSLVVAGPSFRMENRIAETAAQLRRMLAHVRNEA